MVLGDQQYFVCKQNYYKSYMYNKLAIQYCLHAQIHTVYYLTTCITSGLHSIGQISYNSKNIINDGKGTSVYK